MLKKIIYHICINLCVKKEKELGETKEGGKNEIAGAKKLRERVVSKFSCGLKRTQRRSSLGGSGRASRASSGSLHRGTSGLSCRGPGEVRGSQPNATRFETRH